MDGQVQSLMKIIVCKLSKSSYTKHLPIIKECGSNNNKIVLNQPLQKYTEITSAPYSIDKMYIIYTRMQRSCSSRS